MTTPLSFAEEVREALEGIFGWGVGTNSEDIRGNETAYLNLKNHAISEALTRIIAAHEREMNETRLDELVKVSEQFNPKDGKPYYDQDLYIWIWQIRAPELDPTLLKQQT
jgi:hypothetical protein